MTSYVVVVVRIVQAVIPAISKNPGILNINDTEIDWKAYMQEVKYFLDGERNYMNIRGDTGPLVYPAGFLYVFSALYHITQNGTDIRLAQYLFGGIYISTIIVMLYLYKIGKTPSYWICLSLILSKRIHSIFMLRMFNDCIAVLFAMLAIILFTKYKWRWGSILFSCG
eukprot:gene9349-19397_t